MTTGILLKRIAAYSSIALAASVATLLAVRARAAGVPDAAALTYTGYLENPDGTPVTGTKGIGIAVYAAATGGKPVCEQKPQDIEPVSGRFQIALPDDCTDAVKANPDLWVEVQVEGALLGRTKLGAVPYAIEAAHATAADSATSATGLAAAPTFFSWSALTVPSSNVEAFTAEGAKTITFDVAGYYRITLNAQGIHDIAPNGTLFTVLWHLSGTATRLDNMDAEGGGKNVQLIQSADSRQVTSTVLFVKATKGQTIQVNPSLTCVFTGGTYHQANFMYATEYLGPP